MDSENKKTILLVEDEPMIAMLQKQQLVKIGYTVHHESNGEDAVKIIIDNVLPVDLILMDIDLGSGIDGTQAAEQILSYKDIPVVFLSSHTEPEVVEKTEKITSYGYVVKNTGIVVLDASIKMALKLFETKIKHQQAEENTAAFREFMDSVAGFGFVKDKNLVYINANRTFCDLLKIPYNNISGMTDYDIFPADLAEKYIADDMRVIESGKSLIVEEVTFNANTGQRFIVQTHKFPWLDKEKNIIGLYGMGYDVTELKQAEENLQKEKDFLKAIIDSIPVMITRYDPNANLLYLNKEFERKIGWKTEELKDINLMEEVYPDPAYRKIVHKYMERAVIEWQEFSVRAKSGENVISEWSNICLDDGTRIGIGIDITKRKRAEVALRESEALYRLIANNTSDSIWIMDADLRFTYLSPSTEKLFGYSLKEWETLDWNTFVDPDYLETVLNAFSKLKSEKPGKSNPVSVPVRHKNGTEMWVEFSATALYDENNVFTGTVGITRDISERKKSEQDYKTLFNEMLNGFALHEIICDTSGTPVDYRFLNINPAFERMTGLKAKDIVGRKVLEVLPGIEHHWIDTYGRVALTGEPVFFENYSSAIGKYFKVTAFRPATDQFACIFEDITERTQAEEKIQKQITEKETLLREVHHRVKNNIANIEGLLMLQADSNANTDVKSALQTAITHITSMRVLYDKLLRSDDYKEVSIKNYIESLIDSIIVLFPGSENITIEKQITDLMLNTSKIVTIGISLNEILTNAFKHAFTGRDSGHISVILSKTENHVTLIVQDNGVGLDNDFDLNKSSGFGMNILKMFGESCTIENHKGTRVILNFDI